MGHGGHVGGLDLRCAACAGWGTMATLEGLIGAMLSRPGAGGTRHTGEPAMRPCGVDRDWGATPCATARLRLALTPVVSPPSGMRSVARSPVLGPLAVSRVCLAPALSPYSRHCGGVWLPWPLGGVGERERNVQYARWWGWSGTPPHLVVLNSAGRSSFGCKLGSCCGDGGWRGALQMRFGCARLRHVRLPQVRA